MHSAHNKYLMNFLIQPYLMEELQKVHSYSVMSIYTFMLN